MKRRLKLWMLLALVAGFALVFAGFAAATPPNRQFWFGTLFGAMIGILASLPVVVLPWTWNRWTRRNEIDKRPRAQILDRMVVLTAVLITAGVFYVLFDRGGLEWFLDRSGLLDWIVG